MLQVIDIPIVSIKEEITTRYTGTLNLRSYGNSRQWEIRRAYEEFCGVEADAWKNMLNKRQGKGRRNLFLNEVVL